MTARRDRRGKHKLWAELCGEVEYYLAYPEHERRHAARSLEALVTRFEGWEHAHPDYHPCKGYMDVAATLQLLRFAVALAKEAAKADEPRRRSVHIRKLLAAANARAIS